ncbi:MAG: sensor histidine kinase [Chloroflexi bacterium]|nr:sensor histidine kinase [Chloroflexota bacterium]
MVTATTARSKLASLTGIAISNPVAFFYFFRCLTWLFALALIYLHAVPVANARYQPGLLLYVALQLSLGILYTTVIYPRLNQDTAPGVDLGRFHRDLLAMGIADMVGSLAILFWSGGLGTPFFHFVATSLMVPCFLLPNRWGLMVTALFSAGYIGAAILAGDLMTGAVSFGASGFRTQATRDVASLLFIAAAVAYLGHMFRSLQLERRHATQALEDTSTMFSLTQELVQGGSEVHALLLRLAQVIRHRGVFGKWALFLKGTGGNLEVAASTVGIEEVNGGLAEDAFRGSRTLLHPGNASGQWQAAVPLKVGDETLGVMLAGGSSTLQTPEELTLLAEAVAGQIAIGLHNALLALQKADLAAEEERSRIAREIHDGIAQSIYMLSLHLETCTELAVRGHTDLPQRLEQMVGLSKQALMEVRHYIFDLKPYLAGEQSAAAMIASQVNEFSKISGVPASFEMKGELHPLPVTAATCLYRVTQEALANVFRHAAANQVKVTLEYLTGEVRLTVTDNGRGFDAAAAVPGHGLENMHRRAQEAGGSFRLSSAPDQGAEVSILVPYS